MAHDYKEMVKVLRAAKERIEDGRNSFVCTAINEAAHELDLSWQTPDSLRRWINQGMGNCSVVENWLSRNHPALGHKLSALGDENEGYREYRLAWIDNMIEELQKP